MSRYAAHAQFFAPAEPTRAVWRVILGGILISALYMGLTAGVFALFAFTGNEDLIWEVATGSTPLGVYGLLASFLLAIGPLWLVVRFLHKRSLVSLLGNLDDFKRDFLRIAALMIFITLVFAIVPKPEKYAATLNMSLLAWLPWVPLALVLIFVQISAEELMFRGYIQSQLAARFKSFAIWAILPSVLFGVIHWDSQTFGPNAWIIVFWACAFGLVAADLTARTGNLGAAISIHFFNNVSAFLLVGMPGDYSALALFVTNFGPEDTLIMRDAMWLQLPYLAIIWASARLILKR